jgi:hypothetical protein
MFAFDEDIAIACVYFDHKQEFEPVAILRSILKHVIQRQGGLSDEIRGLYKRHTRRETQPMLKELSEVLRLEMCDLTKIFVVIDALDECTSTDNAPAILLGELQNLHPKLRLLVTGRPFAENEMSLFPSYDVLEVRARDIDVENFVRGRIQADKSLRRYASGGNKLERLITETVVGKAKGM